MPIIDFHCDLLGCVEHNRKLNFYSPETNCSLPQLRAGGVALQTMAVAALTRPGSTAVGKRQLKLYKELLKEVKPFSEFTAKSTDLHTIIAIENASVLAEESDPLDVAFENLENMLAVEKILYISLTWNHENRFGGGNASKVGLKPDGKALLDYIADRNIAIDLSHTSDALARDILSYTNIIPIASHSNFRAITDVPRNLPDDIAREIIKRGGVIGIVFVRRFLGDTPEDFLAHINHGISLGGESALCIGADFYGGIEDITASIPGILHPTFQPAFANSSCYPDFIKILPPHLRDKITHQNALHFMESEVTLV